MCYIYSVNTIKAHELVSCVKNILVMNNIAQISKAKHITKTVISLCLGKINIDNMKYLKKQVSKVRIQYPKTYCITLNK